MVPPCYPFPLLLSPLVSSHFTPVTERTLYCYPKSTEPLHQYVKSTGARQHCTKTTQLADI